MGKPQPGEKLCILKPEMGPAQAKGTRRLGTVIAIEEITSVKEADVI